MMEDKDSENKQWTDPKDFGLPYVEIKPLDLHFEDTEDTSVESETPTVSEVKEVQNPDIATKIILKEDPLADSVTTEQKPDLDSVYLQEKASSEEETINQSSKTGPANPTPIEDEKITPKAPITNEKKSTTWVWIAVLLTLGVVSVIVWQLMGTGQTTEVKPLDLVAENRSVSGNEVRESSSSELTLDGEFQNSVDQDFIDTLGNSSPIIINPAETGTTIADVNSSSIIRIESKAERPRYFIVVGSLSSERLALREAKNFQEVEAEIFLITPYEKSKNYRLAIRKYNSLNEATKDLKQLKSQYSESLWILKY